MLKIRLIPCIIVKGHLVVQSFGFKRFLPIGNIKTAIEFFVNWDVDEIVILDIDASKKNFLIDLSIVRDASKKCFVPLTIGGGIKNIADIKNALRAGADKVCINTKALLNPEFITEASEIFGRQCITVSIDATKINNEYFVFNHNKWVSKTIKLLDWAKKAEELGAGEILLNSVDRDGARTGYDIEMLKLITSKVNIPVIACGGVGKVSHLTEGITKGHCQAVAAANIFQHTEHSTIAAKSHMKRSGLDVRLSSEVKYDNFEFDHLVRPV